MCVYIHIAYYLIGIGCRTVYKSAGTADRSVLYALSSLVSRFPKGHHRHTSMNESAKLLK